MAEIYGGDARAPGSTSGEHSWRWLIILAVIVVAAILAYMAYRG